MNYSAYFAIEKKINRLGAPTNRADLIYAFTEGSKTSLKDLSDYEYKEFLAHMNWILNDLSEQLSQIEKPQRRKVIALFCNMGYVTPELKPDMERINQWCVQYGHLKVKLNDYHHADLTKLVSQAEAVHSTFIRDIF